ncbi:MULTISPECIES: M48 family metallopeptidase [Phenylobacterium]|uniref:Membrane-associated protease RseP (Regulator of RpoE activity) n=1 Tax=Phenylobacterium koreense TaxID=266125 RepID=A0ABV2EDC0_9CAUL
MLGLAACAAPATQAPTITATEASAEAERQSQYVIERRRTEMARLSNVANRIRVANEDLCPRKTMWIGATFETIHDYAPDLRSAAVSVLALGDQPQVTYLVPAAPAEVGGLEVGDRVVAVDGKAIPKGAKARRVLGEVLREASADGALSLTVERNAANVPVAITPKSTCGYNFALVDGNEVNAYADGDDIFVYRGLLRFVETDDELAAVVGHEFAHNAMGHIQKSASNRRVGVAGGLLIDLAFAAGGVDTQGAFAKTGGQIGGQAFSQEFETEADYVGMYYLARAGYDMSNVEGFWRRMAAEDPTAIKFGYSHPTTPVRSLNLSKAREEIEGKRSEGVAIAPTLKPAKE